MPTPSEYSSPNKEEDAGLDGHWAAHVLRTLGRTGGVGVGVESLLFDRGLISFARLFQSYTMTMHIPNPHNQPRDDFAMRPSCHHLDSWTPQKRLFGLPDGVGNGLGGMLCRTTSIMNRKLLRQECSPAELTCRTKGSLR